jgi:hypothetical protein
MGALARGRDHNEPSVALVPADGPDDGDVIGLALPIGTVTLLAALRLSVFRPLSPAC